MTTETTSQPAVVWNLETRRAFRKLPLEKRRQRLAELAKQWVPYEATPEEDLEREIWQGGDIVEE